MLRVIGQDLLYHETPVAMSSVIRVNFRRIVMRPHVQMMLHNLALRSPSVRTQAMINPSVAPTGSHIPPAVAPLYSPEINTVDQKLSSRKKRKKIKHSSTGIADFSACVTVRPLQLLRATSGQMWIFGK